MAIARFCETRQGPPPPPPAFEADGPAEEYRGISIEVGASDNPEPTPTGGIAEVNAPASPDVSFIPELPPDILPEQNTWAGAGAWIDTYTDYARCVSPMTPDLFHESAALFLAAVAIARRLVLKMPFGDVYPNLFISWIAVTTFFRKSTALNIARETARDVYPFLLAAQDTTPEAFLSDLAGKEPSFYDRLTAEEQEDWKKERDFAGQRGLFSDEMSGLLAASGKDYNQGLTEILLRLHDCDNTITRSTRGQGKVTVKNSCLSILGASTPAAMSPHISSERLWSMGFWPRFAILTPDIERPTWQEPTEAERPAAITDDLRRLFNRLPVTTWPDHPQPLTVSLGTGVYQTWNRYNRAMSYDLLTLDLDNRLYGTYGRLPTQALKIAMILAALDWDIGNAPRVEQRHMARSISIAESWRASAHRVISIAQDNEIGRLQQRILNQIAKHEPNGATIRDIHQMMKDKRISEVELTISEMVMAGYLNEIQPTIGKRGRPTKRYLIAKE